MESASTTIESISSAFDILLPSSFLHDTRQVGKTIEQQILAEESAFSNDFKGIRLQEFRTTRNMCHELLSVLSPLSDAAHQSILPDHEGCITWPKGISGSISHTKGICSVVVAKHHNKFHGIGIDIETLGRLSEGAKRKITSIEEQEKVESFAKTLSISAQNAYTLIFSAKEALFKRQFPQTRLWLDFQDAATTEITEDYLQFQVSKLETTPAESNIRVYYRFTATHVVSATW